MSHQSITDPQERVRLLSKQALSLAEIDFNIPLARYFRAAKEVIRTAQYYEKEHFLENAFVLYSKYITLFVEKFPSHPQYKKLAASDKQTNYKNLNDIFAKAEDVKKQLVRIYSKELEEVKSFEKALLEEQQHGGGEVVKERNKEEENEDLKELEEKFKLLRRQEQQNLYDSEKSRRPSDSEEAPPSSTPPPAYASALCDAAYPPSSSGRSVDNVALKLQTKPTVDRSLKPSSFASIYVGGLKTVHVPSDLATEFLNRVQWNTNRNVETCAILCGRLQQNRWRITHVLIPNQLGKSDSCDIENDEEIVHFLDVQDLVTLGWIHTHPSQTSFLSSVDQHTHWPYQKLLPEAIAIVCAPKFKETGYFHLTPSFGMDFVQRCKGQGFHEHPIQPAIFQECSHIQLESSSKIIVEDLRRFNK